MNISEMFFWKI